MVGVNVGIPVPLGIFGFTGHKQSFFGDLHCMGRDGFIFFTESKNVTTTWFTGKRSRPRSDLGRHHDPLRRGRGLDLDAIVRRGARLVMTLLEDHELVRLGIPRLGEEVRPARNIAL